MWIQVRTAISFGAEAGGGLAAPETSTPSLN